jgi:hypothetical protein
VNHMETTGIAMGKYLPPRPRGDIANNCSPRSASSTRFSHQAATTSNVLQTSENHEGHSMTTATHTDEASGSAGPSPTESVGCSPHGDHWHCDGPASTAATTSASESDAAASASASTTSLDPIETGNSAVVEGAKLGLAAVLAGVVGAMAL